MDEQYVLGQLGSDYVFKEQSVQIESKSQDGQQMYGVVLDGDGGMVRYKSNVVGLEMLTMNRNEDEVELDMEVEIRKDYEGGLGQ